MPLPLAVLGVGLVSGVGLTGDESCAAIRCGINNFQETRFIGGNGEWLVCSTVQLEEPWRGMTKLIKMDRAVAECRAVATTNRSAFRCWPYRRTGATGMFCSTVASPVAGHMSGTADCIRTRESLRKGA